MWDNTINIKLAKVKWSELSKKESNEIPVEIKSKDELNEESELSIEELNKLLLQEKEKAADYESKLKRALADLQNLERKTKSDIESGVNTKIDQFMIEFLQIYDDFVRAKEFFSKNNVNIQGLESILKNMNSLLSKYNILPIDALGEIFDPKLHEAISIIEDPTLEENTITKELRKGYISHNRVIRPTLVEISKKTKSEKLGEWYGKNYRYRSWNK